MRVSLEGDDCLVVFQVGRKGGTDAAYRMIYDFVNEKGGVCHDLHHPNRIRSLCDDPLQNVG